MGYIFRISGWQGPAALYLLFIIGCLDGIYKPERKKHFLIYMLPHVL